MQLVQDQIVFVHEVVKPSHCSMKPQGDFLEPDIVSLLWIENESRSIITKVSEQEDLMCKLNNQPDLESTCHLFLMS